MQGNLLLLHLKPLLWKGLYFFAGYCRPHGVLVDEIMQPNKG